MPGESTVIAAAPDGRPALVPWRPSRWLAAALVLLGAAGALALGLSALPRLAVWMAAPASLLAGLLLARREWRRPPCALAIDAGGALSLRHGGRDEPAILLSSALRGPLVVVRLRTAEGRRVAFTWWPDTLPPAARRALRLALPADAAEATQMLAR